jgi:predicted nucleic-acid-binding protein
VEEWQAVESRSNADRKRAMVADIVEGLLTAPQLAIEKADVIWRALRAFLESKTDFSDRAK